MAVIRVCKYCGRQVLNKWWHSRCRLVFCEDLLARVQAVLLVGKKDCLPGDLANQIIGGIFTTSAEFKKQQVEKQKAKEEKELWELKREEATRKFLNEWDEKHPDPNPPLF